MISHGTRDLPVLRESILPVLFTLMFVLLSTSCKITEVPPQKIDSVRDAVNYPHAESFTFTGIAETEHLGIYTWRNPAYKRPFGSDGKPDPFAMWVVPVVDRPVRGSGVVYMWATLVVSGANNRNDDKILDEWLDTLRSSFNGKEVKARVMVRSGDERGSGWEKAIRNAELKHGLKSHPLAPVVAWPSTKASADKNPTRVSIQETQNMYIIQVVPLIFLAFLIAFALFYRRALLSRLPPRPGESILSEEYGVAVYEHSGPRIKCYNNCRVRLTDSRIIIAQKLPLLRDSFYLRFIIQYNVDKARTDLLTILKKGYYDIEVPASLITLTEKGTEISVTLPLYPVSRRTIEFKIRRSGEFLRVFPVRQ